MTDPLYGNAQQKGTRQDAPASPYGPQPYGHDAAAGGADSSPHETEATGERMDDAKRDQKQPPGQQPPKAR